MADDPLDFLNDPDVRKPRRAQPVPPPPLLPPSYQLPSHAPPPYAQWKLPDKKDGWTILEYAIGAAAGFIAGIFFTWLLFAFLFNIHARGEILYLLYLPLPGLPLAVIFGMYLLGRRRF